MPETELVTLHARGLGPIDDALLEFAPGFNVLTGETGAGKTLLVGALSLCLGLSDAKSPRGGNNVRAAVIFQRGDEEISLSRESGSTGRWRAAVDGLSTSVEALRSLSSELMVIYGQHDSQKLRGRGEALRLVDKFGSIDDTDLREVRAQIRDLDERRARYGGDPAARERELDFLKFQLGEIDHVAPRGPDELDEVLERLAELTSVREHITEIAGAIEALDGDGAEAILHRFAAEVQRIPSNGPFGDLRKVLRDKILESRDVIHELANETAKVEHNPELLEQLEVRAGQLSALSRKFGGSLADVLAERERMTKELTERDAESDEMARSDVELESLRAREELLAVRVRQERERSAKAFAEAVRAQLSRVALVDASLEIEVRGVDGSDVEILFTPNPGRPAGPLHTLASGGELSRVLLAISLVTMTDGVVAVFDEIDAGVGGSVAQQIGECLAELAQRQQVIVVTHLASVAAKAQRHFVIEKQTSPGSTVTRVRAVTGDDRVSEIARMLAGESDLSESRALAEKLLRVS